MVHVEPRSTFTYTRGFLYIASTLFICIKFYVRTHGDKLRDSGNRP